MEPSRYVPRYYPPMCNMKEHNELQQRLATVEAVSRNRLETILLLHDCYRDACSEADSILSDLRKLEAERDQLTDRIKELEDDLAEEIGMTDALFDDVRRLVDLLSKISEALNTPWPFPNEKTEHDELLVESAAEAGKSLQLIGNEILKVDWSTWGELPDHVKDQGERLSRLAIAAQVYKFLCGIPKPEIAKSYLELGQAIAAAEEDK